MDFLTKDISWFSTAEGAAAYAAQPDLENKTIFLYTYLTKVLDESYDKDATTFRLALFLADAVAGAALPYSAYPALISYEENPFIAYLVNWKKNPGKRIIHYGFLSILHQIADPKLQNSWMYDKTLMESDQLEHKLVELEHNFFEENPIGLPNPRAFDIAEELKPVQLKLMWLFAGK